MNYNSVDKLKNNLTSALIKSISDAGLKDGISKLQTL